MVCKVCNMNSSRDLTNDLLDQMTDEIYKNVEPENDVRTVSKPKLKNGDVINPNAKEEIVQKRETRQTNFLLRDLIKILLLREWGRPSRPPMRPPMGPGGAGNMHPPRPGRPPLGPPPRPSYY